MSAFNSLAGLGARPAAFIEVSALSATPTSGDVILPGGSGQIAVTLVNNGGATAGTVRGTLTSDSPFATVTSGASNFPSLAPGGSGSNADAVLLQRGAGRSVWHAAGVLAVGLVQRSWHQPDRGQLRGPDRPGLGGHRHRAVRGRAGLHPGRRPGGRGHPARRGGGPDAKLVFRIDGETCNADIGSTTVGLDHTWVGDLIFRLTSPAGTTVTVINQAGGPNNSGNNFCQTALDDDGETSIQTVTPAQNPYTGRFAPASPQSAFNSEDATGTWNLNVSDVLGIDSGNVRAFSIDVSGFDCTPAP